MFNINEIKNNNLEEMVPILVSHLELYEALLNSLDYGILVLREEQEVFFTNKNFLRMIPSNKKGKTLREFILNKDFLFLIENALLRQDNLKNTEFIFNESILSLSLSPFVQQGFIRGFLCIVEDITEKKHKNYMIRQLQALNSLVNMSAGIAHEIKNPLAAMQLHIQILQKKQKNKINKNTFGSLKEIHTMDSTGILENEDALKVLAEEVKRLDQILNDFLFNVRPIKVSLESKSINVVLKNTLELVSKELEQKKIHLIKNFQEPIPSLLLDNNLIKQVIINLIKNAREACESKRIKKITIKTYSKNSKVYIEVEDNGIGMTPEVKEHIFEPYFTTKNTGTGLGLNIVFKIIQEHKGEIDVESELGKGTKFIIKLPIYYQQAIMLE